MLTEGVEDFVGDIRTPCKVEELEVCIGGYEGAQAHVADGREVIQVNMS